MSLPHIFLSEFIGTAFLLLLGVGVCANVTLRKSKAAGGGWLLITIGWGLAVFVGVYVAYATGAHLNPAITLGFVASGKSEFMPGIPITFATTITYIIAQLLGAIVGAVTAWLAFKQLYDEHESPADKLGTFATAPAIRSYGWNVLTEAIATFVLVSWVMLSGYTQSGLGPLAVSLVIVAIGASLGGPTGYAINPVRDLGPRIAHALLPIKGKGSSDWAYAWVPIVGPIVGGVIAGAIFGPMFGVLAH
ncbi:MAG: aquaporin family protein [Actinomycetaceae bacterium]|nr:aquaporin family protein [Arcanobacterium sp.]MDD7686307.1 aquaporin family protein [Actinomycetaceae bacterium]MDY5274164.1 MIP/aquaporin family protein [Arcanobacterium sp.]